MPIRIEKVRVVVKIEAGYAAKSYNVIHNYGRLVKEEWTSDGYWIGLIEIPGGVYDELIATFDQLTKGKVESKKTGRS